jgi:hypothetical protein
LNSTFDCHLRTPQDPRWRPIRQCDYLILTGLQRKEPIQF